MMVERPGNPDDTIIIQRLRNNDASVLDVVIEHYGAAITTAAYRILNDVDGARDIAHDVLLWVWENRKSIAVKTTLLAYLIGAARNRALNVVRNERGHAQAGSEFVIAGGRPGMGSPDARPDVAAEREELARALQAALDGLPPRAREIAALRWQDGLGRREIAEILGITISTVSNTLVSAAKTLRIALVSYLD